MPRWNHPLFTFRLMSTSPSIEANAIRHLPEAVDWPDIGAPCGAQRRGSGW